LLYLVQGDVIISNVKVGGFNGYQKTISTFTTADNVLVPAGLSNILPANVGISIVRYSTEKLFQDKKSANNKVGSGVLSVSVEGVISGQVLNPPVELSIYITGNTTKSTKFTCAYYDFAASTWMTNGCTLVASRSSQSQVVCQCSHLTNFAVLLDYTGSEASISPLDSLVLGYITTIGLSISVILMGIVFVVYLFYKV
jgi:hypothetical protein